MANISFNTALRNVSSNLYGVYFDGPIMHLIDELYANDNYVFRREFNNRASIELVFRGEQDAEKLKRLINAIGNNREMRYHNFKIDSISFDYVIGDGYFEIKGMQSNDILLEYLISMLHIMEGRATQEDWDMQFLFTENAQDIYTSEGHEFSYALDQLTQGKNPSLMGFKFSLSGGTFADMRRTFYQDLGTPVNKDYEYDIDDFERFDYARYGEPVIGFEPYAHYVYKVVKNEQQRQFNAEYDIADRAGRGLDDYTSIPKYNHALARQGYETIQAFRRLKRDLIKLNK